MCSYVCVSVCVCVSVSEIRNEANGSSERASVQTVSAQPACKRCQTEDSHALMMRRLALGVRSAEETLVVQPHCRKDQQHAPSYCPVAVVVVV